MTRLEQKQEQHGEALDIQSYLLRFGILGICWGIFWGGPVIPKTSASGNGCLGMVVFFHQNLWVFSGEPAVRFLGIVTSSPIFVLFAWHILGDRLIPEQLL